MEHVTWCCLSHLLAVETVLGSAPQLTEVPRAGSVQPVLVSGPALGPGSVPGLVPGSEVPGPALDLVLVPGSVTGSARMKQALVGWLWAARS